MLRSAVLLLAIGVTAGSPARAQAHMTHHHPRGAKILMKGTVVDPVCAFALSIADSAQARCVGEHSQRSSQPVLLANGDLYVLGFDSASASRVGDTRVLLGKRVKVDGTVYPAGASYLIVVDSIRELPR